MADAASFGAVLSILLKLFPDNVASILAWTEAFFGLGYSLGRTISFINPISRYLDPFIFP